MKTSILLCCALISACCPLVKTRRQLDPTAVVQPLRTVKVCVFNDVRYPVNESAIRSAVSFASYQWESYVDVRFEIDYIDSFNDDMSGLPGDKIDRYRVVCRPGSIALFFSNGARGEVPVRHEVATNGDTKVSETEDAELSGGKYFPKHGETRIVSAEASTIAAVAIFYRTEDELIREQCESGTPRLFVNVMQEIGHIFTEGEHGGDTDSFMYKNGSLSCGRWDKEMYGRIKRNRTRVFK